MVRQIGSTLVVAAVAPQLLSACGEPTAPREIAGVVVEPTRVLIDLVQVPALTAPDGFLFVPEGRVVVLHLGDEYVAYRSICTHAGCAIDHFATSSSRLVCFCHGSQFDTSGAPVVGPANTPLPSRQVEHDVTANRLTVARG